MDEAKRDIKIFEDTKKYSFIMSPHSGMLKEIVANDLVKITYPDEDVEYKLVKKGTFHNLGRNDEIEGIIVRKKDRPFSEETKSAFLFQSLYLSLAMALAGILISLWIIFTFSLLTEFVFSFSLFVVLGAYLFFYVKKGFSPPVKGIVLIISFLLIFGISVAGYLLEEFSAGLITAIVVNLYWFFVTLELILKPAKIILSKNSQYWVYYVKTGDNENEFYMITPKTIRKEK